MSKSWAKKYEWQIENQMWIALEKFESCPSYEKNVTFWSKITVLENDWGYQERKWEEQPS